MAEQIGIRPATIVIEGDSVLLVESKYQNEEFYLFPGGGVEFGETLEDAAKRETLEETGYKVDIIRPVFINEYLNWMDKSKRVVNIFFLAKIKNNKKSTKLNPDNGKIISIEWVKIRDLHKFNVKPAIIADMLSKKLIEEEHSIGYSIDYKNKKR